MSSKCLRNNLTPKFQIPNNKNLTRLLRSLSPPPTPTNNDHSFIQVYSFTHRIFSKGVRLHLKNTEVTLPSRLISKLMSLMNFLYSVLQLGVNTDRSP